MVPTDALIFYESNSQSFAGNYVEHRKIGKNGKMGAGRPLTIKAMSNIVSCVEKYAKEERGLSALSGTIPDGLLYAKVNIDSYKLVWYRKPQKRKMYFKKDLGIPDGYMFVPGMVYVADRDTLRVYCFKGYKPRDILYRAPFFNVSEQHVCLGSAKVTKPKENTYSAWIQYWETMFWQSEFVHILGDNPCKGNLATITKQCIKTGTPFPNDALIRTKVTLKSLQQ